MLGNLTAAALRPVRVKDADRDEHFSAWAAAESPHLLRLARFLAGEPHAGEDLLQDVLARMYARWARIEDPSPYARRALVNASASRWRRREHQHEVTWDVQEIDLGARLDPSFVRTEQRRDLLTALQALPARQRAVIVLRYLDDRSEADVADLLEISVGTVKSQTSRALARLRAAPGDPFGLAALDETAKAVSSSSPADAADVATIAALPQRTIGCTTRQEVEPS